MKNRLEDKAKTIVAALTIAITLILNLSKIIEGIPEKFSLPYLDVIIFILALLSIVYMLMAGVMCIQVLIKENIVHQVPLIRRNDRMCIYENTQLNIKRNQIRNNIIYTSYKSIRNSVACLVIITILAICPYPSNEAIASVGVDNYKEEEIVYDTPAVKWMIENSQMNFPISIFLDEYNSSGKDGTKSIYSKNKSLMVTVERNGNQYIIKDIKGDITEISE